MLPERKRTALWLLLALAGGIALRCWCIRTLPQIQGDALLYGEFARNWLTKGIYGFTDGTGVRPTLIRLPGYPLFLAACFRLFGVDHLRAALWVQLPVDLLTCCLLAGLALRVAGRAAWVVWWLALLLPFQAMYVAAGLTETLTLFTIVAAFWGMERWLAAESPWNLWLLWIAAALGYSILLRPDQGLLAAAVVPVMLWWRRGVRGWAAVIACCVLTVLPLAPWTVRNWKTFHVLQPLAPRYANDPGEANPYGFQRWYRTWAIDYASTEDVYWKYDGEAVDPATLPERAFDSPQQKAETLAAFAEYNATALNSAKVDAMFAAIAAERVKAHPFAYYVWLPLARVANMLFRPRVEWFGGPLRWWTDSPLRWTLLAWSFGALNLGLIALAVPGAKKLWQNKTARPVVAAMLLFVLLRCLLLMTVDNSEPRYTLEFMPVWCLLAAGALRGASRLSSRSS